MSKNYAGQNLNGRSFRGADLRGADFSGCQLKSCDFTDFDLTGAKFFQAQIGINWQWKFLKWILAFILGAAIGSLMWLLNKYFTNFVEIISEIVGVNEKNHNSIGS